MSLPRGISQESSADARILLETVGALLEIPCAWCFGFPCFGEPHTKSVDTPARCLENRHNPATDP